MPSPRHPAPELPSDTHKSYAKRHRGDADLAVKRDAACGSSPSARDRDAPNPGTQARSFFKSRANAVHVGEAHSMLGQHGRPELLVGSVIRGFRGELKYQRFRRLLRIGPQCRRFVRSHVVQ
jgi:hypothetical protein